MTPAKKKAAAKKPCPPASPAPPILTAQQRRWWHVIERRTLIGGAFFLFGLGIFCTWILTDKVHGWEKWAFGFAMGAMVFGALLMDMKNAAAALRELVVAGKTARKA